MEYTTTNQLYGDVLINCPCCGDCVEIKDCGVLHAKSADGNSIKLLMCKACLDKSKSVLTHVYAATHLVVGHGGMKCNTDNTLGKKLKNWLRKRKP